MDDKPHAGAVRKVVGKPRNGSALERAWQHREFMKGFSPPKDKQQNGNVRKVVGRSSESAG